MDSKLSHKSIANVQTRVHPQCIVCSSGNARGLHLDFHIEADGSAVAEFSCETEFEGYPGVLHGGVITSILDGAMGNCIFARGRAAVTVEMTTRFRHPVYTNQQACVRASMVRHSHPLYLMEAEIFQGESLKASAKGKFYDKPDLAEKIDLSGNRKP